MTVACPNHRLIVKQWTVLHFLHNKRLLFPISPNVYTLPLVEDFPNATQQKKDVRKSATLQQDF